MKVWLDDRRPAPRGWRRCYSPSEVIELLQTNTVTEISLDHDLGLTDGTREQTGYDVLLWIEQQVVTGCFVPPVIHVHSANSVAHARMLAAIESIERLQAAHVLTVGWGERGTAVHGASHTGHGDNQAGNGLRQTIPPSPGRLSSKHLVTSGLLAKRRQRWTRLRHLATLPSLS